MHVIREQRVHGLSMVCVVCAVLSTGLTGVTLLCWELGPHPGKNGKQKNGPHYLYHQKYLRNNTHKERTVLTTGTCPPVAINSKNLAHAA